MMNNRAIAAAWLVVVTSAAMANEPIRTYEIWEPEQAPNRGADFKKVVSRGTPYDQDWEQWSYPIGNGYVGANLFGRTDTERIQITEKTLHNKGCYNNGGATNFAELYLDFNHTGVTDYRRSLNLNEAIAHVSYTSGGVAHSRQYFASYPDNVLVVRLDADRKGALSLTIRPQIPYLDKKDRTGEIIANDNLLTLKGTIPFFKCNYEGQIKVINSGGSLSSNTQKGTITVNGADSLTILIVTGTNYQLGQRIFAEPPDKKLDSRLDPHEAVSSRIAAAERMGFETLKKRHLADYQNLFDRVSVNLDSKPSSKPTHVLLEDYKKGTQDPWLEELMFQYGRYLLIASSREKSLPANLQGVWTQFDHTPWSGGYWHNINVQMNYWGAMSANLPECFEAYLAYFQAYLPRARKYAEDYVRKANPKQLGNYGGDNGWIIGTGANAYHVGGASIGHSGPGTGGFTSKLLMDYYLYTMDRKYLEAVAYPAMLSLSKFYSKALIPHGELLLVEPSSSPENTATKNQLNGMPGHMLPKGYYITAGCTFDQGFVWENFNDTLALAKALGKNDPFLDVIRKQMPKLDPIQVGTSGQIKEYREEQAYSDIGDPNHRHISHLCGLYPGTLINSQHPDWMKAAAKTLDLRGDKTTGWALAHRMNCRARLGQGDQAHAVYSRFIRERTVPNLWTLHPPFQIDGNFGTMAGVVEMLLQSHDGSIAILPALPKAWRNGSFSGLVARGNFIASASWKDSKVMSLDILSRSGGTCRLRHAGIESARIKNSDGKMIKASSPGQGEIAFETSADATYHIAW